MFRDSYEYIIDKAKKALDNISDDDVKRAVNMIKNAKQIFIYGSGRSGLVGKFFAMRLVQLGFVAYFIGETITPIIKKDDLVLLISNTGRTKSTLLVEKIARRIGVNVIAITSHEKSPLAKHATTTIVINPSNTKANLAPLGTLFEISTVIFLDSLVSNLLEVTSQTEEDMRGRHAIWV